MKRIISQTVDMLVENDPQIEQQRAKYEYGIDVFFSSLLNMLGILVIYALLGFLQEGMVLIVFFASLRTFAGGYHAQTRFKCFTFFLAISGIAIWLYQHISFDLNSQVLFIGLGTCLVFVAKFAPMDTSNKPIGDVKKRKYRTKSIMIVTSQMLIIFSLYKLSYDGTALAATLGVFSAVFTMLIHLIQQVLRGEFYHEFKSI